MISRVMSGANVLGTARPTSHVLWQHPDLAAPSPGKVQSAATRGGMPVLALGEAGDGRAVAFGAG